MASLLNDSLLIFGSLAILLAPMALALAEMGPGGAGWKFRGLLGLPRSRQPNCDQPSDKTHRLIGLQHIFNSGDEA